jgi:hypothetical protein
MSNKPNPTKLRAIRRKGPTVSDTFSDLAERVEFNKNIGNLPAEMEKTTIVGTRGIVVRRYKFEKATKSDGKSLMLPKFQDKTATEGKQTAEFDVDNVVFSPKAIICSISDSAKKFISENFTEEEAAKFVPGATVWLTTQAFNYPFSPSLDYPMHSDFSFYCIHPNYIYAFEDTPTKLITFNGE